MKASTLFFLLQVTLPACLMLASATDMGKRLVDDKDLCSKPPPDIFTTAIGMRKRLVDDKDLCSKPPPDIFTTAIDISKEASPSKDEKNTDSDPKAPHNVRRQLQINYLK